MRNVNEEKVFRPLVYICSPYKGDVEKNTETARRFSRFAMESGQIPLVPQLMYPQFMSDENPEERKLVLFMDTVLLGKCQELWVLTGSITEGMALEIEVAKRRGQKIRYFNQDFQEVEA